ncbi:MAG: terpene cyclase/mutase family protein [Planctomycetaceae bacterium]|nr:terpene cyclase/mutase family protein [Planctomycetaceae bacterium]
MVRTGKLRWIVLAAAWLCPAVVIAAGSGLDADVDRVVSRGLDWLASHQSRLGHWTAGGDKYPTAMTALSGIAFLCEGSTTTQGKYAANIRRTVDYLVNRSRTNGLIGDPTRDDRYTYGHGFAMLFLSQVVGEEEDAERREELVKVLTKAVEFTGRAQTDGGGWGYVSAKDGGGFDEGSTTITQVQGLRGCRNAGIPVPKEVVDKAIKYIKKCTGPDGGVRYNLAQSEGGGRPPITAAAIACLFNAGDYDSNYVPRILKYCHQNLDNISTQGFGHWHYAHYYYAQVLYRQGGKEWETYKNKVFPRLVAEAGSDGSWNQGYIGTIFTTAVNLTILQLPKGVLPIYQR